MKPLGFYEIKQFAESADGAFCFHDMTKANRSEIVWSDEDFDWILFHNRMGL